MLYETSLSSLTVRDRDNVNPVEKNQSWRFRKSGYSKRTTEAWWFDGIHHPNFAQTQMDRLMSRIKHFLTFSSLVVVMATSASAFAQPLNTSALSPYNALIFGDFNATISDVEGNAAVGGNLETVDYSFGFQLDPTAAVNTDVLTVQGDSNMTRTRVYHGDFVHTGTNTLLQTGVDGTIRTPSTFDFTAAQDRYIRLSNSLSDLPSTGTATSQFNRLSLVGDPTLDTNVFLVTEDLWLDNNGNDVTVIDLDIPTGSTAIINVAGTSPEISFLGFQDVVAGDGSPFRRQTLFNFFEAEEVTTQNIGLEGSLLAPTAHLNHLDAVIDGQVIAASFNGNGQIDLEPFTGALPVSIPEPGSQSMLVVAFCLLLFARQRYSLATQKRS